MEFTIWSFQIRVDHRYRGGKGNRRQGGPLAQVYLTSRVWEGQRTGRRCLREKERNLFLEIRRKNRVRVSEKIQAGNPENYL